MTRRRCSTWSTNLTALLASAGEEDELCDMLLRLHGMAHTVINGAGMTAPTGEESLPELAFDISAELLRVVTLVQSWLRRLEPIEQLTPRN